MDADGDYDDSQGVDSPAEERAEYARVRIPMSDVRAARDPREDALASLAGRPSDPLLNRAVPGYEDIPILEDMTMLPGGRTAAVDDLREAGALSTGLARKQWPDNLLPRPHERATYMHGGNAPAPMSGAMKAGAAGVDKFGTGAAAAMPVDSAARTLYGPPSDAELSDAEYAEMQSNADARARIEREMATAQAAVPRGAPLTGLGPQGAGRASSGADAMTPEDAARAEALRRLYGGR